jgi:hypothetical protein
MTPEGVDKTTRNNAAKGLAIFLAASLNLMAFASDDLQSRAYDLPQNAMTAPLVEAAEAWHRLMTGSGIATLSAEIKQAMEQIRTARW